MLQGMQHSAFPTLTLYHAQLDSQLVAHQAPAGVVMQIFPLDTLLCIAVDMTRSMLGPDACWCRPSFGKLLYKRQQLQHTGTSAQVSQHTVTLMNK